jgi:predicted secreted protein
MPFAAGSMIRFFFAVCLMVTVAVVPMASRAADDKANKTLGLTNTEFAVGVAAVVTGARVAFVLLAGNTLFGRSFGTGLLALYLGHVLAEGVIYGAGAGAASAYAVTSSEGELDAEKPPSIQPQRLGPDSPAPSRLPLEMPLPPEAP